MKRKRRINKIKNEILVWVTVAASTVLFMGSGGLDLSVFFRQGAPGKLMVAAGIWLVLFGLANWKQFVDDFRESDRDDLGWRK